MIWLAVAALSLGVLAFLAWPLFRSRNDDAAVVEEDYLKAQVAEIERDRAAGALSDDEASVAGLEARRRLLHGDRTKTPAKKGAASPAAKQGAVLLVGAVPAAAVAIYLATGSPGLEPTSRMPVAGTAPAGAPPLAQSIAQLEAQLAATPEDLEGWRTLAESYAALDRFAESASAFERAAALAPGEAILHAALGEALTMANDGVISPEAAAALRKALEIDPAEPRARFYLAMAAYQAGEKDAALGSLVALANDAADGTPWLGIVHQEIETIAAELGAAIGDIGLTVAALQRLTAPVAPTPASDIAALEAEIAGGDAPYTAWLALAEAYSRAGDAAKVADTLTRAEERWRAAPFVMQEIAAARTRLAGGAPPRRGPSANDIAAAQAMTEEQRAGMIAGMVDGLAARLEENPDDPEGWMMLGRSYGVLGRRDESVAAFARAVALRPDDLAVLVGHAQALLARLEAEQAPIDGETKAALEKILSLNEKQPFALFFLGVAAEQRQDAAAARAHWEKLLAELPADSGDAARLREMIEAL